MAQGSRGVERETWGITGGHFPSEDPLGIPLVRREIGWDGEPEVPSYLVPYRTRFRTDEEPAGGCAHFFLADYRFESAWSRPEGGLSYVRSLGMALTPDFSLYPQMPLAAQLWQVYRNRWCGAYWQSQGVGVIPTVGWSDEASFPFCFLGVEQGSAVAISTVGLQAGASEGERRLFLAGYGEMVHVIEPSVVLVYGENPHALLAGLAGNAREVPVRTYPSRWKSIRAEKQRLAAEAAGGAERGRSGRALGAASLDPERLPG